MNAPPRSEGYARPAERSLRRACCTARPSHADLWHDDLDPIARTRAAWGSLRDRRPARCGALATADGRTRAG